MNWVPILNKQKHGLLPSTWPQIYGKFVGVERLSHQKNVGITEKGFKNYGDTLEYPVYERNFLYSHVPSHSRIAAKALIYSMYFFSLVLSEWPSMYYVVLCSESYKNSFISSLLVSGTEIWVKFIAHNNNCFNFCFSVFIPNSLAHFLLVSTIGTYFNIFVCSEEFTCPCNICSTD